MKYFQCKFDTRKVYKKFKRERVITFPVKRLKHLFDTHFFSRCMTVL